MTKYIDAEEFKNGVMAAMTEESTKDGALPLLIGMLLCGFVDNAPAADVQEVVRCKDCKYVHDEGIGGLYCNHPDNRNPCGCRPDDYCSDGERKEGMI